MSKDPPSIGRYQVIKLLGQGAMGAVYLAQDPLLKRRLAVKVVKATGDEQHGVLVRFQREAEISARLNDPNIITIYDVGEDPELGPFLAMEYVEGNSLGALIRGGALDTEEAIRLLAHCAKALVAAEGAGVVHRDVKPENILVSHDGRLKLMDFGIARGGESKLTTAGMIVGTPSYTAPELLRGSDASPATDRYALAATAFEIFSGGRMPHPGDTLAAIMYHIIHEPPVIPEGMDSGVAKVLTKAMDLDPSRRYADLRSFLVALGEAARVSSTLRVEIAALPSHGDFFEDERETQALGQITDDGIFPDGPQYNAPLLPPGSGSSGRLLMPKESSSGMVQEDVPTEDALDAVEEPESHSSLIPPKSMLRASGGNRLPEASNPRTPTPRPPAYRQPLPSELSREAREISSSAPSRDYTHWFMGAALLLLGAGGWAFYNATATRSMHITSTPLGASLQVDGQQLPGRTPFDGEVKKSAKELIVDLGYHNRKTVNLNSSDTTLNVPLELWKDYTYVFSTPSNAEIYVDGAPKGTTPLYGLELPISSREQVLTLKKDGFKPWSGTLKKGRPLTSPIILIPNS